MEISHHLQIDVIVNAVNDTLFDSGIDVAFYTATGSGYRKNVKHSITISLFVPK